MTSPLAAALWAAFSADSLALAPHWIYDPAAIATRWGRVDSLLTPDATPYHRGKRAGDSTHYGDQALALLRALHANHGTWSIPAFWMQWDALWTDGQPRYIDSATRSVRVARAAGLATAASTSSDLGGASRGIPLMLLGLAQDWPEPMHEQTVAVHTALTHSDPRVADAVVYFLRTLRAISKGAEVCEALRDAAHKPYAALPAQEWASMAMIRAASAESAGSGVHGLGAACSVSGAFAATVFLVARHAGDLQGALVENVMAGGDSAARGLLLGAVLGAALGMDAVPSAWREGLAARAELATFGASHLWA